MTPSFPMMTVSFSPYRVTLREELDLSHEEQVVEIPIPPGSPALFFLRDETGGGLHPVQASRENPERGYLLISLERGQTLALVPAPAEAPVALRHELSIEAAETGASWLLRTGALSLELPAGEGGPFAEGTAGIAPGPVVRLRSGAGPWRGRTFFDTRRPLLSWKTVWRERGPLRAVFHYRAEWADGRFYELLLTADAPADFVRCEETFRGGADDQIVWDFAGSDLPEELLLLDSNAGHAAKPVHYHFDQRHARLWAWTQYSQLHDLSDGFALGFRDAGDVVGWVALEGGSWDGNALNHLEAWTRRWETADPATRRLPAEAKADSLPGPEAIPARGRSVCAPHFTLEGWLRQGRRLFALVLSDRAAITPPAPPPAQGEEKGCSAALGHFEYVPDRARYRRAQGRLRRIHIQHGMLSLQAQLAMTFSWPTEVPPTESPEGKRILSLAYHSYPADAPDGDPDRVRQLDHYLEARVAGFWEGSGAAYSNCVVGRRIAPEMLRAESLARAGKVDPLTLRRWRAWFAFLAYLNASENYYPGTATMQPLGHPQGTEPTLAGMANQNFYTDVITLFGMAGQVFPAHPEAAAWRARFQADWRRQLAHHVYPQSGLWEESHTYFQHVLLTVLPLFLRRREDGQDDAFADPALQLLLAGALPQLSPRDAAHGGWRHPVVFGDHYADAPTFRHLYPEYARALAPHAPELARRLAWAGIEMGAAPVPGIEPLPPSWASGHLDGLGFFFRSLDETGTESLLALRGGSAWGHHHNDEGSFQFFAHGRALVVDSAFGRPQQHGWKKVAAEGHSRAALEGTDPLNYLWRFSRGWITEARAEGDLPYAVAGIPTYMTMPPHLDARPLRRALWELRAVVELAPALYLVADYLDVSHRHAIRFHVAHSRVDVEGTAAGASWEGVFLRIAPLFETTAPSLSLDAPTTPDAAGATTQVEYRPNGAPWSLFLVGAFPQRIDAPSLFPLPSGHRAAWPGGAAEITLGEDGTLLVKRPGQESALRIDPARGIGSLRALC